jgi:16S rRNA (adenine1518-N6/adenine1519-N6)-dimethyltransferase
VEYLRTVPSTVFLPQPDVDSAFVKITPRDGGELPYCSPELFTTLVRRGFSQRRKQLQKMLREAVSDWPAAAAACGCDTKARAEELSLTQWIALTNFADPESGAPAHGSDAEQFAVVDGNDRVIGQAPRREVHANNLLHRAVHILIFNRAGELLLQKRSRFKDRHPNVWDSSAAGHVDAGEEYDATAVRELHEELGISTELSRVAKLSASERTGQEFIWLYRGEHDGPFRIARGEIEHAEFFPPTLVSAWLAARPAEFAPGFAECWSAFTAALQGGSGTGRLSS